MGWGIHINNVYLPRIKLNEVDQKIEKHEQNIEISKLKIIAISASTPRDIHSEDGFIIRWEDYIIQEITKLIENIGEDISILDKLYIIRDNPEECKEIY